MNGTSATERTEVLVVGAGPAGASLAARLASRGRTVVVLERRSAWRWHACGVFAGPAVRPLLQQLGIADPVPDGLAREVPAMRLETLAGTTVRLTYGADRGSSTALAFDRGRLDSELLALARSAGADVRCGATATDVALGGARPRVTVRDERGERRLEAEVVVGADGIRSIVARSAEVTRRPRIHRVGLTYHVPERRQLPTPDVPVDARMVVLGDAYCGLAPVPGDRVNVGLVLRGCATAALARDGAAPTASRLLGTVPSSTDGAVAIEPGAPAFEPPAGAAPLGHRVARRSGRGWLLVGDAAGFLDPFTGEGLTRSLASARLAAEAIDRALRGSHDAIEGYDRAMRARYAGKDAVSLLVQAFLARPALFEYAARRLASRTSVRRTLEAVIADIAPASRAFDPRFLATFLTP